MVDRADPFADLSSFETTPTTRPRYASAPTAVSKKRRVIRPCPEPPVNTAPELPVAPRLPSRRPCRAPGCLADRQRNVAVPVNDLEGGLLAVCHKSSQPTRPMVGAALHR
jgi:hypothetical protein